MYERTRSIGQSFKENFLQPNNISIRYAAIELGMSRHTLSKWVNSTKEPADGLAERIKEKFNYDIYGNNFDPMIKRNYMPINNEEEDTVDTVRYFISYILVLDNYITKFGRTFVDFGGAIDCDEDLKTIEDYIIEDVAPNSEKIEITILNYKEVPGE